MMKQIFRNLSTSILALLVSAGTYTSTEAVASESVETPLLAQYSPFNDALFSTCCLFMVEEFRMMQQLLNPEDIEAESRHNHILHLSLRKRGTDSLNPSCEQISRENIVDMNDAEYLAFAVLYRTCDAITHRDGFFRAHYYGSLPYYEIVPREKYRIAFYTRLSAFPVAARESMISAKKTYLKIVVTINRNPAFTPSNNASKVAATLDCDGSWRTFHEEPTRIGEIFQSHENEFSLLQNDQCEELIMNDLRLTPRIAEKRN